MVFFFHLRFKWRLTRLSGPTVLIIVWLAAKLPTFSDMSTEYEQRIGQKYNVHVLPRCTWWLCPCPFPSIVWIHLSNGRTKLISILLSKPLVSQKASVRMYAQGSRQVFNRGCQLEASSRTNNWDPRCAQTDLTRLCHSLPVSTVERPPLIGQSNSPFLALRIAQLWANQPIAINTLTFL